MLLVGDFLEILGASALSVAAFLIAGLAACLIVVAVFCFYQAHFGAYGPVRVPRPHLYRRSKLAVQRTVTRNA